MNVFSFVPTEDGGFFISSFSSTSWENIPPALNLAAKNAHSAGERFSSVSVGLDGNYFMATRKGNVQYGYTDFPHILKIIEDDNIANPTGALSINHFRWVTFAPDQEGFFACYVLSDGTERYGWDKIPESLEKVVENRSSISCVSMGQNGSWVVLSPGEEPMWERVPQKLEEILMQPEPVKSVYLSLDDERQWFMEYEDGRTLMLTPNAWNKKIKPHLDDPDTTALELEYAYALQANAFSQQALNTQRVASAAAYAKGTRMAAIATLRGQDDALDIINGYTTRTEYRTTYRTGYGNDYSSYF
ncbi:hypothetical protein FRB93_007063 [Tulasnella sp. JGI-2019a]|nr:hypothetical protein FRB93_007063 [Tulasnella sp. JGI-2019a]